MSKRIQLGNIHKIPLPNGKYAFGRVMNDAGLAIYKGEYDCEKEFDPNVEYQFIITVYQDLLTDGKWPVIGNVPFKTEAESWPPPCCQINQVTGEFSIYYKGETRKIVTSEEEEACLQMEVAAVCDREHVLARIMGDNTWEEVAWCLKGKDLRIKENRLEVKKEGEQFLKNYFSKH